MWTWALLSKFDALGRSHVLNILRTAGATHLITEPPEHILLFRFQAQSSVEIVKRPQASLYTA